MQSLSVEMKFWKVDKCNARKPTNKRFENRLEYVFNIDLFIVMKDFKDWYKSFSFFFVFTKTVTRQTFSKKKLFHMCPQRNSKDGELQTNSNNQKLKNYVFKNLLDKWAADDQSWQGHVGQRENLKRENKEFPPPPRKRKIERFQNKSMLF